MIKMKLHFILLLMVVAMLSACTPVVKEKPVALPVPVVKAPVVPVEVEPELVVKEQDILILLSGSTKPYQLIADYIAKDLGEHAIQFTLSGQSAQDKALIKDIKAANTSQVVAIGLKAANLVKGLKDKQVIITQVVNYNENGLITDNAKGVSALPSPEKLFKDWKALSPGLSRVAIVAGKNLSAYLRRAKKAAKSQGIDLQIELVKTDKEFLYRSKKLKSVVEGQWILPDNRVLSGKSLKEVMAYGSRRGRQIVVFSPSLLSFGGFFYVQPDEKAIADAVLMRLADSAGKDSIPGQNIMPVLTHKMGINQNIARQFNLTIPQKYRKHINGE